MSKDGPEERGALDHALQVAAAQPLGQLLRADSAHQQGDEEGDRDEERDEFPGDDGEGLEDFEDVVHGWCTSGLADITVPSHRR
ncbi:hypothetical protein ACFRJ1_23320 [Streptomyces sp. NPDC056773]|uniref:hypothetical protein n=1 Tax=unclassified Streptomyces TaxID=2593676 RepID=UPI00368C69FF